MTVTRTHEFWCFYLFIFKRKKEVKCICYVSNSGYNSFLLDRYIDTTIETNDFEWEKGKNAFPQQPKINTFLRWRKYNLMQYK